MHAARAVNDEDQVQGTASALRVCLCDQTMAGLNRYNTKKIQFVIQTNICTFSEVIM